MKKILVLVQDYPDNHGGIALMYVHMRNKYYLDNNIDVTVLNFSAVKGYVIDGIKVISLYEYTKSENKYDILALHAPNIRNHFRFLLKYEERFGYMLFFFHGHEILKLNETYPKPYKYMQRNVFTGFLKMKFQDFYDSVKLNIWKKYLPKVSYKSDFIFVSRSLYGEFKKYTGLNSKKLLEHVHIIHNGTDSIFSQKCYPFSGEKEYDFITIRNMLDKSVYCIDLLCKAAEQNKDKEFLLIGRGEYFKYNRKPDNITWIDSYLSHSEMLKYIDNAKCALMLTRRDTQGVMSCELATYGIPLITSDIPVCHEIFDGMENVKFVSNKCLSNIGKIGINIGADEYRNAKYNPDNTILKEVCLINRHTEAKESGFAITCKK